MAIILPGKSICPICNQPILADDKTVSTSAFIENRESPLWPYSDAGMHQACFSSWSLRDNFILAFNDYYQQHFRGSRTMLQDGRIQETTPQ